MGVDVIESRIRTARKRHRCDYCGEIIEKGEEYDYQKNIFDGTFYEWHTHLTCSRVASAIWDYCDPDDGMSDQDFKDGCYEICQRFVCPDCEKPVRNDDCYCHRCGQKLMFPKISFSDYVPGEKQQTIVTWEDENG